MEDGGKIMTEELQFVIDFYQKSWNNLLWIIGGAGTLLGVVLPIMTTLLNRQGSRNYQKKLDNVFASKKFDKIIDEIHDSDFYKGATYIPPNKLEIAARQLKSGWNDRAYIRMAVRLINDFVEKLEDEKHDIYYSLLMNMSLLHNYTATKKTFFHFIKLLRKIMKKHVLKGHL
jgi:hypothetical protein